MKFISWNVNGLRACEGKGFSEVFRQLDADFFCLQETKMQEGQLDLAFEGYQSYWNYAEKKGYSGTAVFTRHQPLSVTYGIGIDEHDHEGRVVTLEMPEFFHEEIDIKNPKTNRHNAGFTDEERAKFSELLAAGFTDSFRFKYPDEVKYSWWSYRFQARQKNAGWRIDYFVISDRLRERLDDATIHTDILGSDHCPVELTLR